MCSLEGGSSVLREGEGVQFLGEERDSTSRRTQSPSRRSHGGKCVLSEVERWSAVLPRRFGDNWLAESSVNYLTSGCSSRCLQISFGVLFSRSWKLKCPV